MEHLLFSCKVFREFWKQVLPWFQDNDNDVGELKEADLIFITFDYFDIENDSTLAKNENARMLNIPKRVYSFELHSVVKRDKLTYHFNKLRKLISVLAN